MASSASLCGEKSTRTHSSCRASVMAQSALNRAFVSTGIVVFLRACPRTVRLPTPGAGVRGHVERWEVLRAPVVGRRGTFHPETGPMKTIAIAVRIVFWPGADGDVVRQNGLLT